MKSNRFYRLLSRLGALDRVPPELYTSREPDAESDVQLRYLGTAGFVLRSEERTLVLDPYISRPGLRETLSRPLNPDRAKISRVIPHADDVLVGHAHHDHVLDAPALCQATGARLIGSPDVCNVGRAAGLPESQMFETIGREDIVCGTACVRGLPSAHGRVYFNRVTLSGRIPVPPPWPPRFSDLRHGLVLNWLVELEGLRIVHIDTAEFFEEELAGLECDVLCLCAIGRRYRPNYVRDAVRLLNPRFIVPCHWDLFSTPYEVEPFLLPEVDIHGFIAEIEREGVEAVLLPFDGVLSISREA
jgi:L-ascorbate metabolism protein UlaG (beta-lactamase superfamily)